MQRFPYPNQDQRPPKFVPSLGAVVFCVHCFRNLGTESTTATRTTLRTRHTCAEGQLAKEPAAPPPYN